jgi:transcription elongation factor GreA
MPSSYLTVSGIDKLQTELDYLRNVKRLEIANLLRESNGSYEFEGDGDPEFAMLKDQQAFIEGRILELENLLSDPVIIDKFHHSEIVELGTQLTISENEEAPADYLIVGPVEADPVHGLISFLSPLGSALLGHHVGDEVMVSSPGGIYTVKILHIS